MATSSKGSGAGRGGGKRPSPLGELLGSLHNTRTEPVRTPTKTVVNMAHKRAGSWKAAARELGVSESTLRSWRKGTHKPSAAKQAALGAYAAANRRGPSTRTIVAKITDDALRLGFQYNRKGRVNVGKSNLRMAAGTMEKVAKRLAKGDASGAAAAFIGGIGDPWYKQRFREFDPKELRKRAGNLHLQGDADLANQQLVKGSSLRGDGTEAQGTELEERQQEMTELQMGGAEAMTTPGGAGTDDEDQGDEEDEDQDADLGEDDYDLYSGQDAEGEEVIDEYPEYETEIG